MTNPIDGLRDGTLLATFDKLLADQGRLLFAKGNYDEEAATAYGVQLLDFMRLHGEKVREAIAGSPNLLRALRDAETWQPIETAPQDGTEFQAWIGDWEPRCRFNSGGVFEIWGRVDYDMDGWDSYPDAPPTHWMPLPSPPAMQRGGDE